MRVTNTSTPNGINGHLTTGQPASGQSLLVTQLDQLESKYETLVVGSSDLRSKLDSAAMCGMQYDQLADEVDRSLAEVERLVNQCTANGIADTQSGLQHQLDQVTVAANGVAGLGKLVSEYEKAGVATKDALAELDVTDSRRVHTINHDVDTAKTRFTAVEQCCGEHQRLVNAALTQLQDPAHNIAVLSNWVCYSSLHTHLRLTFSGLTGQKTHQEGPGLGGLVHPCFWYFVQIGLPLKCVDARSFDRLLSR